MIYKQFSAQELYCMAELCRKKALYGIPNGFETFPEEEIPKVKIEVLDKLLAKQIVQMDLDGKTVLADSAYQELIDAICDCDACLTVNYQLSAERSEDVIFWRAANGYLRADVTDGYYVFLSEDASGISAYFRTLTMKGRMPFEAKACTVPHIALAKAKRDFADGKENDAVRILMQNGAETIAETIIAGLKEEADYLGLLLMVNRPNEKAPQQAAFLGAKEVLVSLSDTVQNYRNCTRFSACGENDVSAKKRVFLEQFLVPETEDLT